MKSNTNSIFGRLSRFYIIVIAIMFVPSLVSLFILMNNTNRYDRIISNVSYANKISQIAKNEITGELWNIVSGRKKFEEGLQYNLISQINSGIQEMMQNTLDRRGKQKLEVASRACLTLEKNVDRLGENIKNGESVFNNEIALDEIRSIASLLSDILNDFIVFEIETASITNAAIKKSMVVFIVLIIILVAVVFTLSLHNLRSLMNTIHKPISQMESLSTQIASGDLSARVPTTDVYELKQLSQNLNTMAERINVLIQENIEEEKNVQKAEMKALQAQITPHFLYNTFDTIIWLAEEGETEDVIRVTRAFSEFLRISLSRGHEWITVQQELEHVQNYLTIQKIRYADILNYEIEANAELNSFKMLKLILQPLVENAIYHGIKNKRGRGHIKVKADYANEAHTKMIFSVIDDGAGFTEERLRQVREELLKDTGATESLTSVYGLYNVNKRLFLYYGKDTDGLRINSEPGKGTCISFSVPI